jgi:hypothetical protein
MDGQSATHRHSSKGAFPSLRRGLVAWISVVLLAAFLGDSHARAESAKPNTIKVKEPNEVATSRLALPNISIPPTHFYYLLPPKVYEDPRAGTAVAGVPVQPVLPPPPLAPLTPPPQQTSIPMTAEPPRFPQAPSLPNNDSVLLVGGVPIQIPPLSNPPIISPPPVVKPPVVKRPWWSFWKRQS